MRCTMAGPEIVSTWSHRECAVHRNKGAPQAGIAAELPNEDVAMFLLDPQYEAISYRLMMRL